jgi:zinc protease
VKQRLVVLLSVAAAWMIACTPRPAVVRHMPNLDPGERVMNYRHDAQLFTTRSGLQLIVLPNTNTNLVKVDMRYGVGAAEDPAGKSGLAHLLEHLTFQIRTGTDGKGPTLDRLLSQAALYYNAYTIWDETHYTAVAHSSMLPALLALESARMDSPCTHFDEALFAREREVVRNEIRWRSSPVAQSAQILRHEVYGAGHAYERSIGGSDTEIASITSADVCRFFDSHYAPDRAILAVSGNVDVAKVADMVGRLFGGMAKRAKLPRTEIQQPSLRGTSSRHELAVAEGTAVIAFPAMPFADDLAIAQRLLVSVFKERLYALMEKHDFLTAASIGTTGGVRAPLAVVVLSTRDPAQLGKAVKLFFADVAAFQRRTLDEDTLSVMRTQRRAELLFAVEPFLRESEIFTNYLQYASHDQFIIRELEDLDSIGGKHLAAHAAKLFDRRTSHILYVTPNPAAQPLETRATVRFSGQEHDLHDWRADVDVTEAERALTVQPRQVKTQVVDFVLENGLRVLLAPALEYPVVDIRLVLPVGHAHEPAQKPGLARLAMQLLALNRPRVETWRELVGVQEMLTVFKMGAEVDRYMDDRTTTFRMTGLAVCLDGFLWQLHYLIRYGIYRDQGLERQKKLSGRRRGGDEIGDRAIQAMNQALFGVEHPYARPGLDKRSLDRISLRDLKRFRESHYHLGGATLIVTGRFDALLAEKEIRRLFSWNTKAGRSPAPQIPAVAPRSQEQHLAVFDKTSVQTSILIAFDTEAGFTTHHAARMVLRQMVRDTMSDLRQRLGATYGVSVDQTSREGAGLLFVSAAVDRERAGEALGAMQAALTELRTGDIAAAFVRARRSVLRQVMADALHSSSVANELELIVTYNLSKSYYEKLAAQLGGLRLDDIRPLIARELAPRHQVLLARGRRASVEAMFQSAGIRGYRVIE